MNALSLHDKPARDLAVRDLLDRFGLLPTLAAVLRAALGRSRPHLRLRALEDLPDRLREDIGLPPLGRGRLAGDIIRTFYGRFPL
jgi:hypothetical protein